MHGLIQHSSGTARVVSFTWRKFYLAGMIQLTAQQVINEVTEEKSALHQIGFAVDIIPKMVSGLDGKIALLVLQKLCFLLFGQAWGRWHGQFLPSFETSQNRRLSIMAWRLLIHL